MEATPNNTVCNSQYVNHNDEYREERNSTELYVSRMKLCPVTKCGINFRLTTVLYHFLTTHQCANLKVPIVEILKDEVIILNVSNAIFETDDIHCLAIMLYGGKAAVDFPAKRNLCGANLFLPSKYRNFKYHCPLFLFWKRVHWNEVDPDLGGGSIYVFWCASFHADDTLRARLVASDKNNSEIKETFCEIRDFSKSQNPIDFMFSEHQLLLFNNDIVKMTDNFYLDLKLKFAVHE